MSAGRARWFLAALLQAGPGHAHHGTATARPGGTLGPALGSAPGLAPIRPQVTLGLRYAARHFGRLLEGQADYAKGGAGDVQVHLLNLTPGIALPSGTRAGLRIPFGRVTLDPSGAPQTHSHGAGDVTAWLGQEISRLFGADGQRFQLVLRGGLVLPTGHYAPADLSVTDVSGSADGALRVDTYNTQASLGADAWTPFGGLSARWALSPGLVLLADGDLAVPADRTRDGIHWGADATARLGAWLTVTGPLGVGLSLDHRHHFADEVPVPAEPDAPARREAVGGHDETAVQLGLTLPVTAAVGCSLALRLPVWQRVQGIQLMETASGSAGCELAWGL